MRSNASASATNAPGLRPSASRIGMNHIAIEPDRALAERLLIRHGAQPTAQ